LRVVYVLDIPLLVPVPQTDEIAVGFALGTARWWLILDCLTVCPDLSSPVAKPWRQRVVCPNWRGMVFARML